jgi:hypothetical protein
MSSSSSTAPKIGCQHFKSLVKQIKAENNTLCSALSDIIDNVHGISATIDGFKSICSITFEYDESSLHKIIISDNIPHGFKDIHKNSTQNPLNMGHIRLGQTMDDRETAEFGTGLKKALIFLAKTAEIYTRCVEDDGTISFVRVFFDFVEMANRANPEESYEPTKFERISEKTFHENHLYDTGSSITLSNLRDSDITFDTVKGVKLTCDDFETRFRKEISDKMSDLIRDKVIQIMVNNKEVEEKDNIVAMVPDIKENRFYADINSKGEISEVYRETHTNTGRLQIKRYEKSECKFKKATEEEIQIFKEKQSVDVVKMFSLTTKGTPFEETHQYNDLTAVKRNGRCFGEVKLTKQEKDGYSNHIYHELNYTSKKLNIHLGVGSNKRVVSDKSNILMTAIHITQKELNSKFRSFCRTKVPLSDSSSDTDDDSVIKSKPKPKPKPTSKKEFEYQVPTSKPGTKPETKPETTPETKSEKEPEKEPEKEISTELVTNSVNKTETKVDDLFTDLTSVSDKETKSQETTQITISKSIMLLNEMLKKENDITVIEQVTKVLIDIYFSNNVQAKISLKYVPLTNSRIQLLIEIMEQLYPIEERNQPADNKIVARINNIVD